MIHGDAITVQIHPQAQPHTEHQLDQPVTMAYTITFCQTLQTIETAPYALDAENKAT